MKCMTRSLRERVEGGFQRVLSQRGSRYEYQSSEIVTSAIDGSFFFKVLTITVEHPRGNS